MSIVSSTQTLGAVWPWWGSGPPPVAVATVATVVVVVVAIIVRAVRTVRSARRDRVELAVVPTSSFDPSPEEIVRFAAQLLRTHRVTDRIGVPAGMHMARVSLRAAGEGRMVQTISGPARAGSILRQRGFDQVELVAPDVLAERLGGIDPEDPTQQPPDATLETDDPPGQTTPTHGEGGGQPTPRRPEHRLLEGTGQTAPRCDLAPRWSCLHEGR